MPTLTHPQPFPTNFTMTVAPKLGASLKRLRKKHGLTLEQLALQSGVSRSMVSEIERDRTNPTFAVLWSLTTALGVDIAELLADDQAGKRRPTITITAGQDTPEIRSGDGACRLRILSPPAQTGATEWYQLTIQPGGSLVSDAHSEGTVEHFSLFDGKVAISSGPARRELESGDTARYPVDLPHRITNIGDIEVKGLLVVIFDAGQ